MCECYDMASPALQRLLEERAQAMERLCKFSEVLRGTLIERMTQCNKPGCKCMRGERHGPAYYVTVSYSRGRTKQTYVPKERRRLVQRWIENYHRAWEALEDISRINLELLRLKEPLPKS